MKPFAMASDLNLVVANAAAADFIIGTFTMPFYGEMMYQGWLGIRINAAGVQQPAGIKVAPTSIPPPAVAPAAIWYRRWPWLR